MVMFIYAILDQTTPVDPALGPAFNRMQHKQIELEKHRIDSQMALDKERLAMEREKLDFEREMRKMEHDLRVRKLENEYEYRVAKIESDERIKRMELEIKYKVNTNKD